MMCVFQNRTEARGADGARFNEAKESGWPSLQVTIWSHMGDGRRRGCWET